MTLLGAPKGWVVSGELSAFRRTFFFGVKLKWREKLEFRVLLNETGVPSPSDTGFLVVPCVGPTPQCVLSLDFWTGIARMWARPGPSFGPR